MTYSTAQFKHDSNECLFLGRFTDTNFVNYIEFDLYYNSNESSFIGRFSSNGPDYICIVLSDFLQFIEAFKATNSPIYEAYRRAKACNFV